MKKIIEIDIDGVLGDIYSVSQEFINNCLSKEGECRTFNFEKQVTSWGIKEVDPKLRALVMESFSSPEVISKVPIYPGVNEAMERLNRYLKNSDGTIIFNSQVMNEECADARVLWMKRHKKIFEGHPFILSIGAKKKMLKSYIVIEDSAENLKASEADIRMPIKRFHNASDESLFIRDFALESFSDAVDMIIKYNYIPQ